MRSTLLVALLAVSLLLPSSWGQTEALGSGVTVAVVDSGVDPDHPELSGRVDRMSFNQYTPPTPDPLPNPLDPAMLQEDSTGQGTGVASKVAGQTLGEAPAARIMDLQVVIDYTGSQLDPEDEGAAMQALDWLLRNHGADGGDGPRVAVLSFAAAGLSETGANTLAAQAQALSEAGVAIIVPAADPYQSLHSNRHYLTVSSTDTGGQAVDIAAPQNVTKPDVSGVGQGVTVARPGTPQNAGPAESASGTQYAAGAVAGVVARIWSQTPDLPVDVLYSILRDTAQDVGSDGYDKRSGWGVVDAGAALAVAAAWEDPFPSELAQEHTKETPLGAAAVVAVAVALLLSRRR